MSLVAREVVILTEESVYGTFDSAATNKVVLHLPDGNSQTVRGKANIWQERSAAGSNRKTYQGSQQFSVGGTVNTRLFPSQAKVILPWALNLVGTSALDLKSFTIDHKIVPNDNSAPIYKRYTGNKVESFALSCDNTTANTVVRTSFTVIGQASSDITATDMPEPDFTTTPGYPTSNPFVFQQAAGHLTFNGSRTKFKALGLNVKNMLRHPFDEGRFISSCNWSGRDVTMTATLQLLTNADRAKYEAETPFAALFAFTDGTNTATFDLKGRNYFTDVADDTPFAGEGYYQKLTAESLLDVSLTTPNDLSFAQTP